MADETMTDEQILEGVEHKSFAATSDRTAASLSASGVAAEDVARAAAQAAYDKKGEDVQVLDLTELSDVCDYFVLATGSNTRMTDAIVFPPEARDFSRLEKLWGDAPQLPLNLL